MDSSNDSDEDRLSASSSLSTNTRKSDNSWFDPPLENYRFFYQGGGNNINEKSNASKLPDGFFIKPRSTLKLDSDGGVSERGGKSRMSSYGKQFYGSTMSREIVSEDRIDDTLATES